ncbi:MAG: FAD-dependent oxidoreductase, partial [Candidatus Uhrbacteria bacterium]
EEHALPLRSVLDALRIRQCIDDADARAERQGGRARIGIIGGGPIGVELATAISSAHRAVEVMLVERNSRFLDRAPKRLSGVALRQARESGIRVHLDTAVARVNVGVCTLQPRPMKAGEEREHLLCGFEGDSIDVEVDGLIWATGNVYGPLSLAEGLPSDPSGRIRVDNELRVQGERNIFAMGDCAAFGDTGLAPRAAIADHQVATVEQNVLSSIGFGQMRAYRERVLPEIITLASHRAGFRYRRLVLAGFLPWLLYQIIVLRYFQRAFGFVRGLHAQSVEQFEGMV